MAFFATLLSLLLSLTPGLAPTRTPPELQTPGITVALDNISGPDSRRALPTVSGARGRPIVVIDPGHGGPDPGATSPIDSIREKDVTLGIARAIRDELVASGRVRVALTRDSDTLIDLRERYEIARALGASLFISIHADAAPHNDDAQGATIYTLSEVASDREAALLAARENAAGIIGRADLGNDPDINRILIDLSQRESMAQSADFARLLRREASPLVPFRQDYHRFASLIVLKAPDIPSVLFEAGYLTNMKDVAYIESSEGRAQIAAGMRRAIETHFARRLTRVTQR